MRAMRSILIHLREPSVQATAAERSDAQRRAMFVHELTCQQRRIDPVPAGELPFRRYQPDAIYAPHTRHACVAQTPNAPMRVPFAGELFACMAGAARVCMDQRRSTTEHTAYRNAYRL